jgi:hypothetical protein
MKTNKLTLLAAMLATALLVGSSALAQVTEDTTSTPDEETTEETTTPTTNQETTEQTTSAPTQGGTENATPTTIQEATEGTTLAPAQTPAPAAPPTYALSADGQSLVINGTVEVPCADVFRDEQAELAALADYPTVASDEARACEELGVPNPYPAPYLYDTEGFLYTYDPVADRYTAADPASCLLYIYDLVAATFYTYDPATSSYV